MGRRTTLTLDVTADAGTSLPYLCRVFPARTGAAPALWCLQRASVLGRSIGDGVDLALEDDRVSRRHAEVAPDGDDGWRIRDLGSKNGLFVDGARVDAAPLVEGTRVRVGNAILVFRRLTVDAPPSMPAGLPFHGTSVALRRVEESCRRVAPSAVAVLLRGPTGSGKEVFARHVHAASGRPGPFVPVNCAAVSEGLFESAFFGHRKGAFTGAASDFAGFARAAARGTLFLDEVAEMSPEVQAKLLRFLDSGEVTAVGATQPVTVDVRIVAATNQDLETRMADGRFRPDLFARLAARQIVIPPLAERPEDVIDIALHRVPAGLSPDAAEALVLHDWPFNVRELQSVLDAARSDAPPDAALPVVALPQALRARVAGRGAAAAPANASVQASPAPVRARPEPDPSPVPVSPSAQPFLPDGATPSREVVEALVRECDGNVSEIARRVGRERRQVYRWLHRFGLKEREGS